MKDIAQAKSNVQANLAKFEKHLTGVVLPLWLDKGWDQQHGGFHEKLDPAGNPIDLGYKRLTATARQLFVFSEWSKRWNSAACTRMAHQTFDYLMSRFWDKSSEGWITKVTVQGQPSDLSHDLYSTAFAIFALSRYGKIFSNQQAIETARKTMMTVDERMRHPFAGYVTATDRDWKPLTQDLDQNPHMHLLEALQMLNAAGSTEATLGFEQKLIKLMAETLCDKELGLLREHFDLRGKPHPEKGHLVEPGHQFEWYWLIQGGSKRPADPTVTALVDHMFDWGAKNGIDQTQGGVYDVCDVNGKVLQKTKRIWPTTEAIRAMACRWNRDQKEGSLLLLDAQLDVFMKAFLNQTGWNEALNEDMKPNRSDMPVTTAYHLSTSCLDSLAMMAKE